MPLAVGTKLDGYEILDLLGEGGMGEIYRARDPALKREVAIKVLPTFVAQDPNWSPDGRTIVFSTSREAGDDPKSVIRILELDGNYVSTLPGSVGMFSPQWSPDGHSIVTLNPK